MEVEQWINQGKRYFLEENYSKVKNQNSQNIGPKLFSACQSKQLLHKSRP